MGRFFSDPVEQALKSFYYDLSSRRGQEGFQLLQQAVQGELPLVPVLPSASRSRLTTAPEPLDEWSPPPPEELEPPEPAWASVEPTGDPVQGRALPAAGYGPAGPPDLGPVIDPACG